MPASTDGTVVIEASTREGLLTRFAGRFKHLAWPQTLQRFESLLDHGYADARREPDGKWVLVLIGKRAA
jgi:hypothetical protein